MAPGNQIVSREEWIKIRKKHLKKEKKFTRLRDELSAERRNLPWVKVDKKYQFTTEQGPRTLSDLFAGKSQLIIYHFMFGPKWEEGCPSCSFMADNFNGIGIHLQHRDINLIAVSRAPLEKLLNYKNRMGWIFPWVSSFDSDFNFDYSVSFTEKELEKKHVYYNFHKTAFPSSEAPGISVFYKNKKGEIFHTYSCYARGLDMLIGAYHYMDLTPKGRDEDDLPFTMAWVRRRDQYDQE